MSNRQHAPQGGNDRDGGGRGVPSSWRRSRLWRQLRRPDLTPGQMATAAVLIAVAYGATGWAGLRIPFSATYATLIWAPSGIALYGVLRWGWAGALGTALGVVLLNFATRQTTGFMAIDAVGASLAATIAAWLLGDGRFDRLFGDPKRVTRYLLGAVLASPVISAAIGASALKTIGLPVSAPWLHVFVTWWAGDAMGILAITPALLALSHLRRLRQARQWLEFVIIAGSFAATWYLLFAVVGDRNTALPLSYLAIPLMIWIALRFDQAVTLLTSLVVILVAILATARGFGPFVLPDGIEPSYVFLHGYLAVIAVTALYLSASAAAGRRALADLKQEITEQRRMRARLTATNELSGDAIITINRAGLITSFNPAASTLFGYSLPDVIGQPFQRLIPEAEVAEREGQLADFLRTGEHPLQSVRFQSTRYRRKDGSEVETLAAIARINIDEAIAGIIAIRDMTETLGREAALRDALREAQLAIRARNEFLANMSHELRTPLNAIIGFAETLRLKLFGDLNDQQVDYVSDIETSGRHLLTLINGILNYARLEKGSWQPAAEAVDVALAIAASCRMLDEKANRHRLNLRQRTAPQLPLLFCDPVALRQIVINLVDNAIKFSSPDGTIEISAELLAGGERLMLAVRDEGIGIHQSDQHRILEPFTQAAHASTRDHDGLGLGLSIVKRLVEAHQGELQLDSMPGEGTTIRILWPAGRLRPIAQ
ncbi:MAG TPA: ATP-binding protein [Dongiaceae bacterium]|nr:ATP-binding protein [Dongiaceae bacterium]